MNDIKKSIEVLKEQIIKNEKILDGLPEKARARATDLSNVVKACHVAISALEKQIAIQVNCIDSVEMAWLDGYCICGEYVTDSMDYCRKCGQKLDWEVENE